MGKAAASTPPRKAAPSSSRGRPAKDAATEAIRTKQKEKPKEKEKEKLPGQREIPNVDNAAQGALDAAREAQEAQARDE